MPAWAIAAVSFRSPAIRSGSLYPGGAQRVFADGSVRFLPDTIDLATFRAISTISLGEVIDGAKMP